MFSKETYQSRVSGLCKNLGKGIALFQGNVDSPMNYSANTYHFRQDSTFLYYFGIDQPGLNGVIDLETGAAILFGDELTMEDIVWTGELSKLSDLAVMTGISSVQPSNSLAGFLEKARNSGRKIHFLPPYRGENAISLAKLMGIKPEDAKPMASLELSLAIIAQRNIKSAEEIVEIEKAVNITGLMHLTAMRTAKPGIKESDVVAEILKVLNIADTLPSFTPIVTTDGHILHNHHYHNELKKGRLLLVDCGSESKSRYAGDMTRTFPVDTTFTQRQKEVYEICLKAQEKAISALKPGITYKEVHLLAAKTIVIGLTEIGLMKGNADDAVAAGAHALFFPHGLGHMMGLDVHDMENLGENNVGYTPDIQRSEQFGLAYLRLARKLEPGFVLTVEPGIYFIPQLVSMWENEGKCKEFVNFHTLKNYLDFGGIRIEEDYLIIESGARLLGNPIPKSVAEIEGLR